MTPEWLHDFKTITKRLKHKLEHDTISGADAKDILYGREIILTAVEEALEVAEFYARASNWEDRRVLSTSGIQTVPSKALQDKGQKAKKFIEKWCKQA